jgi:hypothetical protein
MRVPAHFGAGDHHDDPAFAKSDQALEPLLAVMRSCGGVARTPNFSEGGQRESRKPLGPFEPSSYGGPVSIAVAVGRRDSIFGFAPRSASPLSSTVSRAAMGADYASGSIRCILFAYA